MMEAKEKELRIKLPQDVIDIFNKHYTYGDWEALQQLYKNKYGKTYSKERIIYTMRTSHVSNESFIMCASEYYRNKLAAIERAAS